jgi:lipopolysaccharide export system ATP-binding protein
MSQLTVNQISARIKTRDIVRNVSLTVNSGEVVGLLGPNGAGKTTCFYMIVGLIASNQGAVLLDNEELTFLPMHIRARRGLGYLPQETSIFRKLTAADNILAILETQPNLSAETRHQTLEKLLTEFHINHIRDSVGESLSGGERRRVEIARACAANPKFMLLDEPFAGVDPISVNDIKSIITHLLKRGIGVLITDHNVRETLAICDRAYIMNEGELIANGPPAAILQHPLVRSVYLGEQFQI